MTTVSVASAHTGFGMSDFDYEDGVMLIVAFLCFAMAVAIWFLGLA
jgi:hypothetical protein